MKNKLLIVLALFAAILVVVGCNNSTTPPTEMVTITYLCSDREVIAIQSAFRGTYVNLLTRDNFPGGEDPLHRFGIETWRWEIDNDCCYPISVVLLFGGLIFIEEDIRLYGRGGE